MNKWKFYWKLFSSTFILSALTIGGGYVIVPLMKKKFVEDLKWLTDEEMINFTAIAQSSPGAIAVNTSILLGYHIAGMPGAATAIMGTVLPPFLIMSAISSFYTVFRDNPLVNAVLQGLKAGIAAVITDVILSMGSSILKEKKAVSIVIMVTAFLATFFFKVNVIYIILACGLTGAAINVLFRKIKQEDK